MAVKITFGEGVGITIGGTITLIGLIGLCTKMWRCCCGDNNLWRGVNWCKKKSSSTESDGSPTGAETQIASNFNCICFNCGGSTTVNNSQSKGYLPISERTTVPPAPPESVISPPQRLPIEDSQVTVNLPISAEPAIPSAPPEDSNGIETRQGSEMTLLVPQPNLTSENPSAAAISESDQPDSPISSNLPRLQTTAAGEVVPESTPSGSMVTTADVHQGSAPQSHTSVQASQSAVAPFTSSVETAPSTSVEESQQCRETTQLLAQPNLTSENPSAAASDQPDSQIRRTISKQPQQQSTEQVCLPPSSMGPSSTRGCVASQPTNKRSFSAKFVGDLGKLLNPTSPVAKDWRLILMELGLSQGDINNVTHNFTEEALRMWQEAGRSLDDLLEVYKVTRPDVCECIERYKKNNEAYSAISAVIVQQTPRLGDTIVTTDQLSKLAHNLGP